MSVSILFDHTGAVSELLRKAGLEAVRASCEAVKDDCEANARIRTGALRASFYSSVVGEESGYAAAVADALEKNPKVQIFDEVKPDGPDSGVVSAAAEHSYWNEYGSHTIAPKPIMHEAADSERAKLPGRVAEAIAKVTR